MEIRVKTMVVKEMTFNAAHFLPDYNGPCRNMHGHTYKLQIGVCRWGKVGIEGIVIDFSELKQRIGELFLDELDHSVLNECKLPDFPFANPTAENIAEWIFKRTNYCIPGHLRVCLVRLWETPTCFVEIVE